MLANRYGIGSPYKQETLGLLDDFISRLKNDSDKRSYARIFIDFGNYAGCDILEAPASSFSLYFGDLLIKEGSGNISHNTILKARKVLAAFIRYCLAERRAGNRAVPAGFSDRLKNTRLEIPKEGITASQVPDIREYDTLVGYLKENDRMMFIAFLLVTKCLLKTGELLSLTKRSVFVLEGTEDFYLMVSGRQTPVHVPNDIRPYLDDYLTVLPNMDDYLFYSLRHGTGVCLTPQAIDNRLKKCCHKALGEKSYSLNDLRVSGATYAMSCGAELDRLSDAMGYRTRAHLQRFRTLTVPMRQGDDLVHVYLKGAFEKNDEGI